MFCAGGVPIHMTANIIGLIIGIIIAIPGTIMPVRKLLRRNGPSFH
jgi:hypothetical protein